MKYLLIQLFLLLFSVILLYYLSSLPSFTPYDHQGQIEWYRVSTVLSFMFISIQAFVSLIIYLVQKFIAYGWKEFPNKNFSLRVGLGASVGTIIVILLHLNHLMNFTWGLVIVFALISLLVLL